MLHDPYPSNGVAGPTVRAVYQSIVDLRTQQVVACEALARGESGSALEQPVALFAAARRVGGTHVQQLDEACLRAALSGIRALDGGATVFLNVEPDTLGALSSQRLEELHALQPADVHVVVEVTERALLQRPAQLLAGVRRARELGWSIAVDDVGADPAALAVMPFLAPDVIKLDLSLVRARASLEVAAIVHAVQAEAERSGALILAEGIESEEHLDRALSMGARLGQGWWFGRPSAPAQAATAPLLLPPTPCEEPAGTPFTLLAQDSAPQRVALPLLAALTRQVERQALLLDERAVVLANFEHARFFTRGTRRRYSSLAAVTAFTAVLGPDMADEPGAGVHGTAVPSDDPLAQEWVVAVVSPHHAVALAARRVGHRDGTPLLDYVLTYDRRRVLQAAALLMGRVQPRAPAPAREPVTASTTLPEDDLPELLLRAIATATNAITIADARHPDHPLVYANEAFLRLSGYSAPEVLGHNCRFMQGRGTDRAQVQVISRRLLAGQQVKAQLLNYRKDGSTFWNALTITPVVDDRGELTHFIGNQVDVTEQVGREERALQLAHEDALTGLPNRRHLMAHLGTVLEHAARSGAPVDVLFLDVQGLDAINAARGHSAGDAALTGASARLAEAGRPGLLGRLGGGELVLVLTGADPAVAAGRLHETLARSGSAAGLTLRIGHARFPQDGATPIALLDVSAARAR